MHSSVFLHCISKPSRVIGVRKELQETRASGNNTGLDWVLVQASEQMYAHSVSDEVEVHRQLAPASIQDPTLESLHFGQVSQHLLHLLHTCPTQTHMGPSASGRITVNYPSFISKLHSSPVKILAVEEK